MRGFLEDGILLNPLIRRPKYDTMALTGTANITMTSDMPTVLELDGTATAFDVTLPTRALANDGQFRLIMNHSSSTCVITVKDASTTLVTLAQEEIAVCFALNSAGALSTRAWVAFKVTGESNLGAFANLTVSGTANFVGAITGTAITMSGTALFNGAVLIGDNTADLVGFWGVTKTSQPTSASQGVVASTAITAGAVTIITAGYGATNTAQFQSLVDVANSAAVRAAALTTLTNQLRADLVSVGIIKGS